MTKQMVIKLNEKKFKPLLDKLLHSGNKTSKTYSEVVAKCVFWNYTFIFEKLRELGDKTALENLLEAREKNLDQSILDFIKKFNEFNKKGSI